MTALGGGDLILRIEQLAGYSGPDTIVFVGVDTAGSSAHRVFPRWAPIIAPGAVLRGLDIPEDAPASRFRAALESMSSNPAIIGAVVTSHKLRLYRACRDLIEVGDPLVPLAGEINCLDLRAQPVGHARDPLSLDAVLTPDTKPSMLRHIPAIVCIGAGGSATALLLALGLDVRATLAADAARLPDGPRPHLTIVGRTRDSVDAINRVRRRAGIPAQSVSLVTASNAEDLGEIVRAAAAGSLIINATGLGKTAPGSPLSGPSAFPRRALAWDFNYRGPLTFLSQARAAGLRTEDGWRYFVAGWAAALAAVRGIAFTGMLLNEATAAAAVADHDTTHEGIS